MSPLELLHRLPSLQQLFPAAHPTLAAELTEEHVSLVRMAPGAVPSVAACFLAQLPAGVVKPSPTAQNIVLPVDLASALKAARDAVSRGGPVSIVLPDQVARVAVMTMDTLPLRREETRELVAWRLKKTLPFRVEDAILDWQTWIGPDGKPLVLAAAVRARVVAEYEQAMGSLGFKVGNVTVSTLAVSDLVPEGEGDQFLINVGAGWFSFLITRNGVPQFYRCKLLPDSERRDPERGWFILGEIAPTLEYHRTRLGGTSLAAAWLHVSGPGTEALLDVLQPALEARLEPLSRPNVDLPAEVAERLVPALAVASRELRRETAPDMRQLRTA